MKRYNSIDLPVFELIKYMWAVLVVPDVRTDICPNIKNIKIKAVSREVTQNAIFFYKHLSFYDELITLCLTNIQGGIRNN